MKWSIIGITTALFSFTALAETCTTESIYDHFDELRKSSVAYAVSLEKVDDSTTHHYIAWYNATEVAGSEVSYVLNDDRIGLQSKKLAATAKPNIISDTFVPQILFDRNMNDEWELQFFAGKQVAQNNEDIITIKSNDEVEEKLTKILKCDATGLQYLYIDTWASYWTLYKSKLAELNAAEVAKAAISGSKLWDKYYYKSRYMYPWEKAFSLVMSENELNDGKFKLPPKYQYFLLRPWAALEYVENADDGSQFKGTITFEWVGINKWNGCFGSDIACGVSLVSTYSDRAGADDFGHGVMLHVANKYSFGVTSRDSKAGFFVTVDLLKAFNDKEDEVKYWVEKVDKYLP
ncbi:hypothetical protein [Agarivorans sp. DSG3-1]|uniref:hypothetical protein n=1 Tax=Agarivorans sp. DSG3-1 TaxID=3342249 RepID=UPI00398EFF9C